MTPELLECVKEHQMELLEILDSVYGLGLTIQPVDAPTPCDRSMSSVLPLSGTRSPACCPRSLRWQSSTCGGSISCDR